MGNTEYTIPQRYAIEEEIGNLLVSAAAGSGKTFTLSRHIVELVRTGKADIGEMLVVTFTRAAASDMKRKIGDALARAASDAKATDREAYAALSRSASRVQSADISTIHSFLYKTLKRYFSSLGLAQDSRLISDTAVIDRMKAEVMRDVTNDLFEAGESDFLMLADTLSTVRETDRLDEELFSLAADLSNSGLDYTALGRYADMLEDSVTSEDTFLSSPFGAPIKASVSDVLGHFTDVFSSLGEEFPLYPEIAEKYGAENSGILEWLASAEKMLSSGNISALRDALMSYKRPRFVGVRNATELTEEFKYQRDTLKEAVASLAKKLGRFLPDEIMLSRDGLVKVLRCAERVLGLYYDGFERKKRDAGILDFSDLEHLACRLLVGEDGRPTAEAREIGAKYKYIFIDEYQDTNKVQDAVFRAISSDARLFMVGDIKQAIYRFRGADPSVFSEYRRAWRTVDPAVEHGYPFDSRDGRVLHMSDNFRSGEPVINLANAVSDYILPFGKIPYGEGDRLICSRRGGKDPAIPDSEVVIIEKKRASRSADSDEDDDGESGNAEIEYIADRVRSMIGRQLGERIIRPGDIAILLRTNDKLNAYSVALAERGIPVYVESEKPLASSPAVMLLECVLNFIDNPLRDVYTSGALRSPVFGFDLDSLVALRKAAGTDPLYLGVLACASDEEADEKLREKCASVLSFVEREKTVSRGMSVKKYVEYLIDALSLFSLDGIRESGAERDAVNRFCSLAAEYEKNTTGACLSSFIDYAAETLVSGEKNGEKPSTSADAVSVLSIHKSKGLEFPVCFVADCGKTMSSQKESSKTLIFEKELGVGMYLPDSSGLARCDTALRVAVAEKIRENDIAEEMRVLYVALTRASDKLIVTAKVSSLERLTEKTEHAVQYGDGYSVRHAKRYIDWINEALLRTPAARVKVTMIPDGEGSPAESEAPDTAVESSAERTADSGDFDERFCFDYPYDYLASIPSKLTVSKLSPTILDDTDGEEEADITQALDKKPTDAVPTATDIKLKKPDFMAGEKWASASERGSATHVFMQFADYGKLIESGAKAELDRLVRERFISPENASLVSLKQIERFAESALMDKLSRSPLVRREFRFNVLMDAADFTNDSGLKGTLAENGVKVTVQGVVDCVYRDPDSSELTLIDYKTDAMTAEEMREPRLAKEKLRARHTNQLTYYRKICAEMFGEPITHAYVYSTVLAVLIEI